MILAKIAFSSAREKFLAYLKNQNKASATILAYGKDLSQLNQFLADLGRQTVDQIQKEDLEAFLKKLGADGFTTKSLSRKLNSLKTFYRFAKSQDFVEYDQTQEIAHPKYETKAPRILSKMEYRALRDSCREDLRTSAIVEIFLQTGLRISELANLKLADIKNKQSFSSNNELRIQALESHRERMVPLNKPAMAALENYLKIRPQTKDTTIFITKTGKPLLIRNIRTALDRYFRLAGIENACVNDLRHTFITQQLANGTPVNVIAKLVGHKRLSTTEKYLGLIQEKPMENVKLEEL